MAFFIRVLLFVIVNGFFSEGRIFGGPFVTCVVWASSFMNFGPQKKKGGGGIQKGNEE